VNLIAVGFLVRRREPTAVALSMSDVLNEISRVGIEDA